MRFGIHTMDDFDFNNKTVICRVDINQPVDKETGELKSIARIEACIPTIRELREKGAKTVLLAHQGSDIEYQNFYTTEPHSRVLSRLLGQPVDFIPDVCGPAALNAVREMASGDVLLLDNVRFLSEEQTLFENKLHLTHEEQAQTLVVRKLAPLADLYICDAFAAAHRDQPTLCGFQQLLPSAMGRLFEKEYCVLSELMENPAHPSVFVLGGAKVADAFLMMETVLKSGVADLILTGGLVGNIMLASQGIDIGKGSLDFIIKSGYEAYIRKASDIYEAYKNKIVMPEDVAYVQEGCRYEVTTAHIPTDAMLVDIGTKTTEAYQQQIHSAATVFVNGPMGIFEKEASEAGTRNVWDALGDTKAYTVIGGGDSIAATNQYQKQDCISYICTGGGALIRFLTGKELPVVKALRNAAAREMKK